LTGENQAEESNTAETAGKKGESVLSRMATMHRQRKKKETPIAHRTRAKVDSGEKRGERSDNSELQKYLSSQSYDQSEKERENSVSNDEGVPSRVRGRGRVCCLDFYGSAETKAGNSFPGTAGSPTGKKDSRSFH